MAKVKFKINSAGLVELMKSSQMQAVLAEYGSEIASNAGTGYSFNQVQSGDRAKAFVHAVTKEAIKDNLKNNTLLKAVGGGK